MPGAAAFLRDLRKSYPLSLAALARFPLLSPAVTSSPGRWKSALKGTPLRYAGNFTVTAKKPSPWGRRLRTQCADGRGIPNRLYTD